MDSQLGDVEPGKVFVGGLSWETTKEGLHEYFKKFGEVTDAVIMADPATSKPRGFGFVTFKDPTLVEKVCSKTISGSHMLDGKNIDPKPATSRTSASNYSGRVKKVFVGGVSQNTTEDDITNYFKQYGTVTDVELKHDKMTGRMKGFGFVGFESEDVVDKLAQGRFHSINGKSVEVKKAEPRVPGSGGGSVAMGGSGIYMGGGRAAGSHYQQQQQQHFSTTGNYTQPQSYYNSQYHQQGFGNYGAVGYNSGYGQAASYGSQQQAYSQQQGYAPTYESYGTARQGQEQVASFGQEQATSYGTAPRTTYAATSDQYSQGGNPAAGYGYATPSATPYNYQEQSPTVAYGRGQPQQRTNFAPPYRTQ